MQVFGGIDPGRQGALVLLGPDGRILEAHDMPDEKDGSVGGQTAILLRRWQIRADLRVTVEKTITLPEAGSVGAHSYGLAAGITLGILISLGIPHTLVIPRQWSAWAHEGIDGPTTKAKSLVAAQRIWPGYPWPRFPKSGKVRDGIVDAALIAHWGRIHRWQGMQVSIDSNDAA